MTAHDSNIRSDWLPVALTKGEATRLADTIRTALEAARTRGADGELDSIERNAHLGRRSPSDRDKITTTKPARWYAKGIDAGKHTVKIRGCNRYRRAAQAIAPAAAHGLGLAYGADEIRERNERMTTTITTTIDPEAVLDTTTVAEDHRNELCEVCGDEMQIGEAVVDYSTSPDGGFTSAPGSEWATAHASHVDKPATSPAQEVADAIAELLRLERDRGHDEPGFFDPNRETTYPLAVDSSAGRLGADTGLIIESIDGTRYEVRVRKAPEPERRPRAGDREEAN